MAESKDLRSGTNWGARTIFEFHNVLDASYRAYAVSGAFSVNNPARGKSRGEAVAIIREFARCNSAEIYRSAREASTAISAVQTFANAVDTINSKLTAMKDLAIKARSSDYSQVQVEEMQKEFEGLAKEINDIVDSTEYKFNKLLTADGKAISFNVSDSNKIDIFAIDLSFNAEGLDLTAEPESVLSSIEETREKLGEYETYLSRQARRLEEATAIAGRELESAMGVDTSEFAVDFDRQAASKPAREILENRSAVLDIQANVLPCRVLELLNG